MTVDSTVSVPAQRIENETGISLFDNLIDGAARIDGGELLKAADWAELEGVPLVIGNEKWLRRRRIDLDTFRFFPEETVIINDGSTGIRRQVTEFLQVQGFIKVAEADQLKSGGKRGESSFDLNPGDWAEIIHGDVTINDNGFAQYEFNFEPGQGLFCVRGLRSSEYSNDYTKEGVTWYLS